MALAVIERLEELKAESPEKGVNQLEVGIGLNTGRVTVGNLGSQSLMGYTVIGDAVNLGSRLEGLNKVYGTTIIIGESTAERLGTRFVLRELDRVRVRGKGDAITIFELLGYSDKLSQDKIKMLTIFESALLLYRNREWKEALRTFSEAMRLVPEDGPTRLYLSRIEVLLRNPPSPEWEPVTVFTSK